MRATQASRGQGMKPRRSVRFSEVRFRNKNHLRISPPSLRDSINPTIGNKDANQTLIASEHINSLISVKAYNIFIITPRVPIIRSRIKWCYIYISIRFSFSGKLNYRLLSSPDVIASETEHSGRWMYNFNSIFCNLRN